MEQQVIEALTAAKRRIEEFNGPLREGSLGRAKNDDVLEMINKLLPQQPISFDPRYYNPDLVYPNKNLSMSETNVATQKPQMQVMQVLQQTPPAQIAELEFVRDKYIQNYNMCHSEKIGEMMYHRQLVHFKQLIAGSDQLKNSDPFTLYACFVTAAVNGYSLDPQDNEVYLIPLKGKAYLWRQAGAHVKRLMRTNQIVFAEQAKLVYEGDDLEVVNGRVVKHVEKFLTENIIAGYIRFVVDSKGNDRFFIYRKSDWQAWQKKSQQGGGDNWTGNGGQPIAAFLRTKIVKHAATEKCWATGMAPITENFDNIEIDDDGVIKEQLPEPTVNGTYQPTLIVSGTGEVKDTSFVETEQKEVGKTVTYTDDDF